MPAPPTQNYVARTNADWAADVQFTVSGSPLNLTGADVRLDLKTGAGTTALTLRVGSGLVLDPSNGKVSVRVPALQMQGIPAGDYAYDLQVRLGGVVDVLLAGTVSVAQGVTRA
jgi:hypothetical protein